jgi:hypothetical protein
MKVKEGVRFRVLCKLLTREKGIGLHSIINCVSWWAHKWLGNIRRNWWKIRTILVKSVYSHSSWCQLPTLVMRHSLLTHWGRRGRKSSCTKGNFSQQLNRQGKVREFFLYPLILNCLQLKITLKPMWLFFFRWYIRCPSLSAYNLFRGYSRWYSNTVIITAFPTRT